MGGPAADPTTNKDWGGVGTAIYRGVNIVIENWRGSTRTGRNEKGDVWVSRMFHHYGRIPGVKGADGDAIDVFLNPDAGPNDASQVVVINQVTQDGRFDEHKVMLGFKTSAEAVLAYKMNYEPGWRVGPYKVVDWDAFKHWLDHGNHKMAYNLFTRNAQDFRETEHPRHADGKFKEKGSGTETGKGKRLDLVTREGKRITDGMLPLVQSVRPTSDPLIHKITFEGGHTQEVVSDHKFEEFAAEIGSRRKGGKGIQDLGGGKEGHKWLVDGAIMNVTSSGLEAAKPIFGDILGIRHKVLGDKWPDDLRAEIKVRGYNGVVDIDLRGTKFDAKEGHDLEYLVGRTTYHLRTGKNPYTDEVEEPRQKKPTLVVNRHLLEIGRTYQGHGIGAGIEKRLIEALRNYKTTTGHRVRIEMTANVTVGGYAWAAAGYKFQNHSERLRILKQCAGLANTIANDPDLVKNSPAGAERLQALAMQLQNWKDEGKLANGKTVQPKDIAEIGRSSEVTLQWPIIPVVDWMFMDHEDRKKFTAPMHLGKVLLLGKKWEASLTL